MLIKKTKVTKITRNTTKLKLIIFKPFKNKLFSKKIKVNPPKDIKNHKTIRSRKKSKLNTFVNYLNTLLLYKTPNLITKIYFSIKLYKFISLIKNSLGFIYCTLTAENQKLFSYFIFLYKKKLKKKLIFYKVKSLQYNSFLAFIKRRSFISSVELFLNKGAQYAKAYGSTARLLDFFFWTKTCAVQLPSKEVKVFSCFSTATNSPLILKTVKKLKFDNKRLKRLNGFGSKVRGVAMNALDHPHGGKTKSIKFPKTPWGLPTKLK